MGFSKNEFTNDLNFNFPVNSAKTSTFNDVKIYVFCMIQFENLNL